MGKQIVLTTVMLERKFMLVAKTPAVVLFIRMTQYLAIEDHNYSH